MATLISQIEMCLNSRPLVPITGDTDDINALTPSHFLIGSALHMIPDQLEENEVNLDRLDHWRLVKAIRDRFWVRWLREYLNTLSQRYKWQRPQPNFQVDDIVLILDPSLLQRGRWPLGKILTVHRGGDGLIRVATVRTRQGKFTRPITKLYPLPTH